MIPYSWIFRSLAGTVRKCRFIRVEFSFYVKSNVQGRLFFWETMTLDIIARWGADGWKWSALTRCGAWTTLRSRLETTADQFTSVLVFPGIESKTYPARKLTGQTFDLGRTLRQVWSCSPIGSSRSSSQSSPRFVFSAGVDPGGDSRRIFVKPAGTICGRRRSVAPSAAGCRLRFRGRLLEFLRADAAL